MDFMNRITCVMRNGFQFIHVLGARFLLFGHPVYLGHDTRHERLGEHMIQKASVCRKWQDVDLSWDFYIMPLISYRKFKLLLKYDIGCMAITR